MWEQECIRNTGEITVADVAGYVIALEITVVRIILEQKERLRKIEK